MKRISIQGVGERTTILQYADNMILFLGRLEDLESGCVSVYVFFLSLQVCELTFIRVLWLK